MDAHGPHWPYGWVRGEDFVEPGTSARASVAEAVFEPFALRYIELLTGVQGDTKAKYRRQVEQRMLPWFRQLDVPDGPRQEPHSRLRQRPRGGRQGAVRAAGGLGLAGAEVDPHVLLFVILQAAVEANPSCPAEPRAAFLSLFHQPAGPGTARVCRSAYWIVQTSAYRSRGGWVRAR